MSLSDHIKSMLPSYEAATLKDDLRSNAKELREHILPALVSSVELFNESPFKDANVIKVSEGLVQMLERTGLEHKKLKDANVLEVLVEISNNVVSIESYLIDAIDKDCGRKVLSDGITFNKQILLQLLESVDFFCRYTKTFLNYVTHLEFAKIEESRQKVTGIGAGDMEFLDGHLYSYAVVCRILGTPLSKLRADYAEVPDMVVDVDSLNELREVFGDRLDIMGFSNVPFPISIIYHARMSWADYQMDRYDDTVATATAVQLRVSLYKKKIATGEGDATVEKLLDIQEKRLMDLRRNQERLEKKYGLK